MEWQFQAQRNIISDSVHKVSFNSEPNSIFDDYDDIQRTKDSSLIKEYKIDNKNILKGN